MVLFGFFRGFAHLLPTCPKIIQICQKLVFLMGFRQKVTSMNPFKIWFYMKTCGSLSARSIFKKVLIDMHSQCFAKLALQREGGNSNNSERGEIKKSGFFTLGIRVANKTSYRRNRCSVQSSAGGLFFTFWPFYCNPFMEHPCLHYLQTFSMAPSSQKWGGQDDT